MKCHQSWPLSFTLQMNIRYPCTSYETSSMLPILNYCQATLQRKTHLGPYSVSKAKIRPNFALFDPLCKNWGGVGEGSKSKRISIIVARR